MSDNEILHFLLALAVLLLHHLSARTRYLVPHLTQKFTHTALSFLLFLCRFGLFSLDAVAEVLLLHRRHLFLYHFDAVAQMDAISLINILLFLLFLLLFLAFFFPGLSLRDDAFSPIFLKNDLPLVGSDKWFKLITGDAPSWVHF